MQAATSTASELLRFDRVSVRFGGVLALDEVSVAIAPGTICGLIGPNGAGKTTLLNCLSRLHPIESGDIVYQGRSLRSVPAHALAGLGIARTFQNLALFASLSVRANVLAGAHSAMRSGFLAHALALRTVAREEALARARAEQAIAALDLGAVASRQVGELALGTRRRVELARALAASPRLLLLDEPASGLTVAEADALAETLRLLRDTLGITVLMIEHRMRLVNAVCEQVVALNFGRKIAEGSASEVRNHPQVIEAWIGPRQ